jgi:hypothetical protein
MTTKTKKQSRFGYNDQWRESDLIDAFMALCRREPRLLPLAFEVDAKAEADLPYESHPIKEFSRAALIRENVWYGRGGFKYRVLPLAERFDMPDDSYTITFNFFYYWLIYEREKRTMTLAEAVARSLRSDRIAA